MSRNHKVQAHKWVDGHHHAFDYFFNSYDEAEKFCNDYFKTNFSSMKITDENGELVHSLNEDEEEQSYA